MIKISSRLLLTIASLTWLCIGIFLLTMGLHLTLTSLTTPHFETDPFSLLSFLMLQLHKSKDTALVALVFMGILIGFFKGTYLLKKTARRQIAHILSQPEPHSFTTLYTKKYLLLIVTMMSFGMALRLLPIHPDVRGFIDIAVGTALIQGATHYFQVIRNK